MGFIRNKEMREVEVVVDVICDSCGSSSAKELGCSITDSSNVYPISASFGYWSSKDGVRFGALLCEKCFDKMVQSAGLSSFYEEDWLDFTTSSDLHKNGTINDLINHRRGQMDLPFEGELQLS
jgi:hypothetical protein